MWLHTLGPFGTIARISTLRSSGVVFSQRFLPASARVIAIPNILA